MSNSHIFTPNRSLEKSAFFLLEFVAISNICKATKGMQSGF